MLNYPEYICFDIFLSKKQSMNIIQGF